MGVRLSGLLGLESLSISGRKALALWRWGCRQGVSQLSVGGTWGFCVRARGCL